MDKKMYHEKMYRRRMAFQKFIGILLFLLTVPVTIMEQDCTASVMFLVLFTIPLLISKQDWLPRK